MLETVPLPPPASPVPPPPEPVAVARSGAVAAGARHGGEDVELVELTHTRERKTRERERHGDERHSDVRSVGVSILKTVHLPKY